MRNIQNEEYPNKVIGTITFLGRNPRGIAITPDGNYVYVTVEYFDKKSILVIGK